VENQEHKFMNYSICKAPKKVNSLEEDQLNKKEVRLVSMIMMNFDFITII
jgi:hypothetical protein